MSYARWSTIFNSKITFEEELELYKSGKSYEEVKELKLKDSDAFISNWYIYWHSLGETFDNDKRDSQFLAVWHKTNAKPIFNYKTIKDIYENERWSDFGSEIDQIDVLKSCLKDWLDDVEADCV